MAKEKLVIPEGMFPHVGVNEVKGIDGQDYLIRNEAMFTGYQHTAGEFSRFFKSLRDDCKILGNRCPQCHQLICPPFQKRCPQCNFIEMWPEEVKDAGRMDASPPIVFFAPARFKDQVPYAEGYVYLEDENGKEADTAIKVRVRTTRGMIKPGIFKKDTKVKVVFADKRVGRILDIFAVPQAELTQEQIAKTPLMESDLSWDKPIEPSFEKPTAEMLSAFNRVLDGLKLLSARIKKSPRAQKDLANWSRRVQVKTRGGEFGFVVDNGRLEISSFTEPDLILAVENPAALLSWLERGSALTNLVMEGTLWVSKPELETISRLDRLPRSLRRDNC
ncbi:MAG: hypothetical protein HYV47_01390 [Candidatus Nealsonbacteria bacterium]|nr:hypothetical protein [Candidatus Nealsonbacteria bacterium]